MPKTVIFGATGYIGQAVARQLVAEGRSVHLVGRDKLALPELAAELRASLLYNMLVSGYVFASTWRRRGVLRERSA